MTTMVKLVQGTQEWLDWRLSGITATEASAAMGVSKWMTPLSVYDQKLNPKPHEPSKYEEWGTRLEPVIRQTFAEKHPEFKVVQGECYEDGWKKCSLDGELKDETGKTVAILEIKTGSSDTDWAPVPEYYKAQVQWQMHVTGIKKVYFAVLIHGHDYFEREMEYDPTYAQEMECKCQELWNAICTKVPPQPDPNHSDIYAPIVNEQARVAEDKQDSFELSDEEYAEFVILKEKCEEFEQKLAASKLHLAQYFRTYKRLTYKGANVGTLVTCKGKESIDAKRLKSEFPEVYAKVYKQGNPYSYPKFG